MFTSCFSNIKKIPAGLEPVAISVGIPVWYRGRRELRLAPTRAMLQMTSEEFERASTPGLLGWTPGNSMRGSARTPYCSAGRSPASGATGGLLPSGSRRRSGWLFRSSELTVSEVCRWTRCPSKAVRRRQ
jgi:hypothetical protein